jgi:ubiquinone/menaquinone biosynthesis C-methylase UbiE
MAAAALQYLKKPAQKNGVLLSCLQMAAEQTGIKSEAVDLVYGISILHHLDFPLCLKEIQRILKPGGRAVFVEPLAHNPVANFYRALTPGRHSEMETPLRYESLRNWGKYFHRIKNTEFYFFSVLAALVSFVGSKSLFDFSLRGLMRIDRALFAAFPKMRRYAWISVIELTK